jgi:hypothetical protein
VAALDFIVAAALETEGGGFVETVGHLDGGPGVGHGLADARGDERPAARTEEASVGDGNGAGGDGAGMDRLGSGQ